LQAIAMSVLGFAAVNEGTLMNNVSDMNNKFIMEK
jgi:hypothetical protein